MNFKTLLNKKFVLGAVMSMLFTASSLSFAAPQQATKTSKPTKQYALATFAGGCFWCMEKPFDELKGVISTTSGYTAGNTKNPTYKQVSAGKTGHTEAVQIKYDPSVISYQSLLDVFWVNIDPLDAKGQFCDKGSQYRAGIFYHNEAQQQQAAASKAALSKRKGFAKVVTEVTQASAFYPAEEYHQDYYMKNPVRYRYYRYGCGRDARLNELWSHAADH